MRCPDEPCGEGEGGRGRMPSIVDGMEWLVRDAGNTYETVLMFLSRTMGGFQAGSRVFSLLLDDNRMIATAVVTRNV